MRKLTLLRHAKSSWDDAALNDHDRPLNGRGKKAAQRIGRELKHRNMAFDFVLSSTAIRARETIGRVQEEHELGAAIRLEPLIYMASVSKLIELVRQIPDEMNSVLLVGHNPGFGQLALTLTDDHEERLRGRVLQKFPTGALAAIELPIESWSMLQPGAGRIVEFITPRELES